MDPIAMIQLATEVIEALATVAGNVTSKGQSQAVSSALILTSAALKAGDAGVAKLAELKTAVQAMADGNREPTDEEFDSLKARSDAAHAAIQAS